MRKNYELKVKLSNYDTAKWKAESFIKSFSDKHHFAEIQKDIYFSKIGGKRLKLRIINNEKGVLIYYDRKDVAEKRVSKYFLSETNNPYEMEKILKNFFKVQLIVNKKREIYTAKNIRIHVDRVQGCGTFLEFEIIYNHLEDAKVIMKNLMKHFMLKHSDFIKESYSDLVLKNKNKKNVSTPKKR